MFEQYNYQLVEEAMQHLFVRIMLDPNYFQAYRNRNADLENIDCQIDDMLMMEAHISCSMKRLANSMRD